MGRLVSIVVVSWNSAATLPRCLDGIAAQTHRDIELIAVDNGSADGSADVVLARIPSAKVIRNPGNEGFSRAVNQGLKLCSGEFVLLVNPDALLLPDYVAELVRGFDRAGSMFGSATGTLIRARGEAIEPTDRIDSKGIRMTRNGRHLDIGQDLADGEDDRGLVPLGDGLDEVFGVSGAAAMHRMTFIRDVEVGGEFLDEDFFTYREDADVAWRGRIHGWRALHVSTARALHVRTVTPARRRELSPVINMHSVKNRFLLRLKNESLYLALRNFPFELIRDVITIGAVLTVERTSLPAFGWLWRNRGRVMGKRREIQRRRRVSDRDLARWFA